MNIDEVLNTFSEIKEASKYINERRNVKKEHIDVLTQGLKKYAPSFNSESFNELNLNQMKELWKKNKSIQQFLEDSKTKEKMTKEDITEIENFLKNDYVSEGQFFKLNTQISKDPHLEEKFYKEVIENLKKIPLPSFL